MRYPVNAPGFASHPVELETAGMFSGARLLQGGEPAPNGSRRGTFSLRQDDGRAVIARFRPSPFVIDPVPALEIDGRRIEVVRSFRWYELTWIALPVVLVFVGGVLGAIVGFVAAAINAQIMRTGQPLAARYLLTAGVTAFAVAAYGVIGILFLGLVGR